MKSIKSKVLVSLLAFALAVTSVGVPSVSAEAATNKKAVKSVTLKVKNKKVNKKTTTLQVGNFIWLNVVSFTNIAILDVSTSSTLHLGLAKRRFDEVDALCELLFADESDYVCDAEAA